VAAALLPVAALAAVGEAREGRGASVYLEAVLDGPAEGRGSR
jgi:hypothetical protein